METQQYYSDVSQNLVEVQDFRSNIKIILLFFFGLYFLSFKLLKLTPYGFL